MCFFNISAFRFKNEHMHLNLDSIVQKNYPNLKNLHIICAIDIDCRFTLSQFMIKLIFFKIKNNNVLLLRCFIILTIQSPLIVLVFPLQ